MSGVEMAGVTVTFGKGRGPQESVIALDDYSLTCERGEFLVLLGPSGCGKSTALNAVAGILSPQAGTIHIDGRCVFDADAGRQIPPEKRNLGMVFQTYSLWPHMNVAENIGYPLKQRKLRKQNGTSVERISSMLDLVQCQGLEARHPSQLSGGQQQRIAVARGLVAEPEVMLFDEPLSNLDALLRRDVRDEIKDLHDRLKFTAIYVTHDQEEALTLGNRIAVMRAGSIVQLDSPERLWTTPNSRFVMEFLGGNTLDGQTRAGSDGHAQVETAFGDLPLERGIGRRTDEKVHVGIHPDRLQVIPDEQGPAEIALSKFLGGHYEYVLRSRTDIQQTLEAKMLISEHEGSRLERGTGVRLSAQAKDVVLLAG